MSHILHFQGHLLKWPRLYHAHAVQELLLAYCHTLLHILCEQYQYLSAERTLLPRFDVTDKDNSSCNDNRVHIVWFSTDFQKISCMNCTFCLVFTPRVTQSEFKKSGQQTYVDNRHTGGSCSVPQSSHLMVHCWHWQCSPYCHSRDDIAAATTNDLFLLKQETVSGSGISWAIMQICTSLQTDNQALIPKTTYLSDRDYIMRMLYKNCY